MGVIPVAIRTKLGMLRFSWWALRNLSNGGDVISQLAAGKNPRRIAFRNGIVLEGADDFTLWRSIYGIWNRRAYDPPWLQLEPGDLAVDIGANVGAFAIYAAGRTSRAIHAFEPHPENLAWLRQNIARNSLGQRITVHPLAVAGTTGRVQLGQSSISGGHSITNQDKQQPVTVEATTLKDFMGRENFGTIGFLKLDCEGGEGLILQATPRECLRKIRKLAMEFHDGVSPLDHRAMRELLAEAGFETRLRWDGRSAIGYLYARLRDEPAG